MSDFQLTDMNICNSFIEPITLQFDLDDQKYGFDLFIFQSQKNLSHIAKRKFVISKLRQLIKEYYVISSFKIIREHSKYLINCQEEENISVCVSYSAKFISISFLKSSHKIIHAHDIEVVRDGFYGVMKRFKINEIDYISAKDTQERFFEIWTKKEALAKLYHSSIEHMLKYDSLNTNTPIVSKKINVMDNLLIVSFACRKTKIYPLI